MSEAIDKGLMNEMLISFFEGTREYNAAFYGFSVPQRATLLIHAVSSILLTICECSANLIIGGIDACCTVQHARRSCSNDGHNLVSLRMGRCHIHDDSSVCLGERSSGNLLGLLDSGCFVHVCYGSLSSWPCEMTC